MGCSTCTKKDSGGCSTEKEPQRRAIADVLARVYPTRTWGQPDDEARLGAGISAAEAARLARGLAVAAKAPVYLQLAEDASLSHAVYVLCVGRAPALVSALLPDGGGAEVFDFELADGVVARERHLRVMFSTVARLACVQEVAVEAEREGDGWWLREEARAGVYDKVLLKRLQRVVDFVEAHDIEHLDFGLCNKPVEDARTTEYVEVYGVEPALVNFLFYPQPATATATQYLPTAR